MVDDILAKYPNDVKVVIKNFPLSFHKQAYKAAQYALAAHAQGKYKEMYHAIFKEYKKLKSNEDWPLEIAQELGLDMNQFRNSGIPRLAVPKFLIQGKEPQGRDLATFSAMIDAELAKLK